MFSLVYVSSAAREFSERDLVELLERSRAKNQRLGITGMLLYKDGNFIQALEGQAEAVDGLFTVIRRDPRHRDVIRLVRREIKEREFADWSMGFRNLSDPGLRSVPGFAEFLNEPLDAEGFRYDSSRARRLLDVFRRNLA
jgi:hypothetical protein